jgi:hypothetical protein
MSAVGLLGLTGMQQHTVGFIGELEYISCDF